MVPVALLADRGRAMPQSLQADAERACPTPGTPQCPSPDRRRTRSVQVARIRLSYAWHTPMPEFAEWSVPDARNAAMSFSRRARVHRLRHSSALRSAYLKTCSAAPHIIDAHYVARERGPCN